MRLLPIDYVHLFTYYHYFLKVDTGYTYRILKSVIYSLFTKLTSRTSYRARIPLSKINFKNVLILLKTYLLRRRLDLFHVAKSVELSRPPEQNLVVTSCNL